MAKKGSKSPESKASKRRVATVEQDTKALALRRTGLGYEKIGEALGIPTSTAYDSVIRGLEDAIENRREEAEKVRQLEIDRLDELLAACWPKATKPNPALIDRVLRIMERRAKLLGLDAPAKQQVADIGSITDKLVQAAEAAKAAKNDAEVQRALAALDRMRAGEDVAAVYAEWCRGAGVAA